jgi:hypothetical protein
MNYSDGTARGTAAARIAVTVRNGELDGHGMNDDGTLEGMSRCHGNGMLDDDGVGCHG